MPKPHLKCCNGHSFLPCNPQGLQGSASFVSTIKDLSDNGVKPNAGTVEQKMAVTGAFTADAKC